MDSAHAPDAHSGNRDNNGEPLDFLEDEEFEALMAGLHIQYVTPLRDRCMLELMHKAGLRSFEVTGIRPRDIKWSEHELIVAHGKGDKWGTVALLDRTIAWLARWAEVRRHNPKLGGEWFFCTHNRAKVCTSHLRRRIIKLRQNAGLDERAHCHALRHSCATDALAHNIDPADVQQQMRHARLATTLRYTHVRPRGRVDRWRRKMEGSADGQ